VAPRIAFFRGIPASLLTLTLGRLFFVPVIILSFDRAPAVTAGALVAFILLDLYDGVLARQQNADDPPRRVLDTVVDRLSIWPVYVAITLLGFLPPILLLLFFARDLYCAYWCHRILTAREVVIRADWMYRSLNLMLAGWVIAAPFLQAPILNALFVGILGFSVAVALDLKRSAVTILRKPAHVRSAVLPAGALRTQHGRTQHGVERPERATLPEALDPA